MTDVHTTPREAHAWDGRTNDRAISIIKFCEGGPKGGKPYECPAGYWTTGYGSLRGLDGKRVTKNSPTLTKKHGEELLRRNLGMTEMRFANPVFHGDTLRAVTKVKGMRESKSRPTAGLVELEHFAFNQSDKEVAYCVRTALMQKRPT